MNRSDQILKDQKSLLQERGYSESAIHSKDQEGKLFQRLEHNLTLALRYAHRFNETYEFEIQTLGKVDKQDREVSFTFEFEYNPSKETLQIKSLLALYGEHEHQYILTENTDLPGSTEVIQKFITMEEKMGRVREMAGLETKGKDKRQKL